MSQTEFDKCAAAAQLYRRLRKQCEILKEENERLRGINRVFDEQDAQAFALVQMNRQRFA